MKKLFYVILSLFCTNIYAQDYSNLFISNTLELFSAELLKNKKDKVFPAISATTIANDYSKNELAAERKYKGKEVRITGVISSIEQDIFGNPFISLDAKNSLFGVKLNLKQLSEAIYELSKGEEIDMTCIGGRYSMQIPSLDKCVFTKDYILSSFDVMRKNIDNRNSKTYKPSSKVDMFISGFLITNKEFINNYCHKDSKCNALAVDDFIKKENLNRDDIYKEFKNKFSDPLAEKYSVENLKSLPMINFIEL